MHNHASGPCICTRNQHTYRHSDCTIIVPVQLSHCLVQCACQVPVRACMHISACTSCCIMLQSCTTFRALVDMQIVTRRRVPVLEKDAGPWGGVVPSDWTKTGLHGCILGQMLAYPQSPATPVGFRLLVPKELGRIDMAGLQQKAAWDSWRIRRIIITMWQHSTAGCSELWIGDQIICTVRLQQLRESAAARFVYDNLQHSRSPRIMASICSDDLCEGFEFDPLGLGDFHFSGSQCIALLHCMPSPHAAPACMAGSDS